jgi:predicted DNA-binding protein (MmcQ/YjbR family)
MRLDGIREYCLSRNPAVREETPFDEETLVYKIGGKIFLFTGMNAFPLRITVKCDPAEGLAWRERHDAIEPGYHMNTKHWITATLDGSIPEQDVRAMIDRSFALVAGSAGGRKRRARD